MTGPALVLRRGKRLPASSVSLSKEMHKRLRAYADVAGVTAASVAEVAIHEYLERNPLPEAQP